ncbi:MAG: MATE family efflux transporter [Oscillospiraceae bacterium]|jgi:putative MATE family efflux protein|nr:MATE family efflux transporter [Oscillospiraceae bacterium]
MSLFKPSGAESSAPLTHGPIIRCLVSFAIPLFLGQLLQQLYNLADAWVLGNFADNSAFAAVSSGGSLTFLVIGFFNGIAVGGGVIISRYYGAGDEENVSKAIHTSFTFGIVASVLSTVVGLLLVPQLLVLMNTPESVLPYSLAYFRIYFGGVFTIILYNICMAIMQSLGDSLHPLYYLILSSILNMGLDLLFVAVFHWGVAGAAVATVLTQGISFLLCLRRMCRVKDDTRLDLRRLGFSPGILSQMLAQGLPAGVQNAVISVGNLVIQSNINAFGEYAMSGHGAYARLEGLVFLPIMSMSMALPTFISQNLGAKQYDRAKKGAAFGILSGVVLAELVGLLLLLLIRPALGLFVDQSQAISFGMIHARTVAPFFCLLAFTHCAAGVLRGCGRSFVPMVTMLAFWCCVRVTYVTLAVRVFPVFQTISWAYPLTWTLSSIVLLVFLLRSDWTRTFERQPSARLG